MPRYVFDIEADGLLDTARNVLCLAVIDIDTGEEWLYRPGEIQEGLVRLHQADLIAGHNIIKYDLPVLDKLHGFTPDPKKCYDTLTATSLVFSNIGDRDAIAKRSGRYFMGKLFGAQSLKAWGVRLGGEQKMEYHPVIDPAQDCYNPAEKRPERNPCWEQARFSEMMGDYCLQDTRVNLELFKYVEPGTNKYPKAFTLETEAAFTLAKMERNGFVFDERKAEILYTKLAARRESIRQELTTRFGGWWEPDGPNRGAKVPKRTINAKYGSRALSTCEGAPYTKIKWTVFNPSSRAHIIKVLTEAGWVPQEFTDTGLPKVDETILEGLEFPEAQMFAEWFLIQKRIGQLAEGDQGWMRLVKDGKIHGSIRPNAAITGRATHNRPNMGQLPSTRVPYGSECRELFRVPDQWVLMGSDASGLELRCLAAGLSRYDKGAYADVVLNGDIHTHNQHKAQLPSRDSAKTFIYSLLYGAGDELIGQQVGYSQEDYLRWKEAGLGAKRLNQLNAQRARRGEAPLAMSAVMRERICHMLKGAEVKKTFMDGMPALSKLVKDCKRRAKDDGFVIGIDGRRLYCRSQHSSVNTYLQGMGAALCKAWVVEVERLAMARGLRHGWDGDFAYCAWVHDEIQVACKDQQTADLMGAISQDAMRLVQEKFNFACRLDTEYGTGPTWKDTH